MTGLWWTMVGFNLRGAIHSFVERQPGTGCVCLFIAGSYEPMSPDEWELFEQMRADDTRSTPAQQKEDEK